MYLKEFDEFRRAAGEWGERLYNFIVENPERFEPCEYNYIDECDYAELQVPFCKLIGACPNVYFKISLRKLVIKLFNRAIDYYFENRYNLDGMGFEYPPLSTEMAIDDYFTDRDFPFDWVTEGGSRLAWLGDDEEPI